MKPWVTEKVVMMIESQNIIGFIFNKEMKKNEIKKEVENIFNVKVDSVRTHIRNNKKYAYIKLNKKNPAIDVATKLGII